MFVKDQVRRFEELGFLNGLEWCLNCQRSVHVNIAHHCCYAAGKTWGEAALFENPGGAVTPLPGENRVLDAIS